MFNRAGFNYFRFNGPPPIAPASAIRRTPDPGRSIGIRRRIDPARSTGVPGPTAGSVTTAGAAGGWDGLAFDAAPWDAGASGPTAGSVATAGGAGGWDGLAFDAAPWDAGVPGGSVATGVVPYAYGTVGRRPGPDPAMSVGTRR